MIETKMLHRLKTTLPWIMIQDIETTTTIGFPDTIYGHEDIIGFMELKELNRNPVNKFKMPWRPGQLAWSHNYRIKYKNNSPYIVVLTIQDSWYFITALQENYTMAEIARFYIGETKDLKHNIDSILHVMFPSR